MEKAQSQIEGTNDPVKIQDDKYVLIINPDGTWRFGYKSSYPDLSHSGNSILTFMSAGIECCPKS